MNTRKNVIFAATGLALAVGIGLLAWPGADAGARAVAEAEVAYPEIVVYKGPQCGCCEKWADHLVEAGFEVKVKEVADMDQIKAKHGIRPHLETCHTAIADGYIIEGHVPAASVKRLFDERPDVAGIVVPGMPMGSPGMEEGPPENYEHYSVLTFDDQGATKVFDRYQAKSE
jgi:hypothetical protein